MARKGIKGRGRNPHNQGSIEMNFTCNFKQRLKILFTGRFTAEVPVSQFYEATRLQKKVDLRSRGLFDG